MEEDEDSEEGGEEGPGGDPHLVIERVAQPPAEGTRQTAEDRAEEDPVQGSVVGIWKTTPCYINDLQDRVLKSSTGPSRPARPSGPGFVGPAATSGVRPGPRGP